ncbi:unnamed protein product [Pieris brassicae]|uniref:Uncharacterized protein n=1 Tax=Pieris brassicae TaxID=7116 RepID=A0A9P0XD54_PIEBR|nr:unnamed protein product [Pieris brassicae]
MFFNNVHQYGDNTKTYLGADCGSDHTLLAADVVNSLRRLTPQALTTMEEVFNNKASNPDNSADPDTNWTRLNNVILSARRDIQQQNVYSG